MNTKETIYQPISAYIMIPVALILLVAALFTLKIGIGVIFIILAVSMVPGFFFVNPNGSRVLTLFGKYIGTVKSNGFFWANPFYYKKSISLRARNFDSERVKVNDKIGNPIMISVILVWRVEDTYAAAFEVNDYENFVRVQTIVVNLRHFF